MGEGDRQESHGGTTDTNTAPVSKSGLMLTLGSIGVVYGDIGTSPLYALRESLRAVGKPDHAETLGIVSLLIWALLLVVTVKYVIVLLRADNRGEGGTLSLMALAQDAPGVRRSVVLGMGMVAAGLFYGDAIITPAISVLSAVEGLELALPNMEAWVLPIAAGVLIGLFVIQARGTGRIGRLFGPIMVVWFAVLAVMGLVHIVMAPQILWAFSPTYAIGFLANHGLVGFIALGSVFLAVTGGEALYADMGHFGRAPIRAAWLAVVLPALLANYLGQGALAIQQPGEIGNLFFLAVPDWARLPMIALATVATVIASQAVISGTFSLTWQAMRLGLLPSFGVRHTSSRQWGQIYIARINWLMLFGVLALMFTFRNSAALAGAYGIAVSGTMVVTTLLAVIVFARVWNWGFAKALMLLVPLLIVDAAFFGSNLFKVADGGYVPLGVAGAAIAAMYSWERGVRLVTERMRGSSVMLADLMAAQREAPLTRVDGTAVFLTPTPELAPPALVHNMKHNRVLHRQTVIMTIRTAPRPRLTDGSRLIVAALGDGFAAVELSFGFMERPDVIHGLELARAQGLEFEPADTSFFVGRRSYRSTAQGTLARLWDWVFVHLAGYSGDLSGSFGIPADRAVELGIRIVF